MTRPSQAPGPAPAVERKVTWASVGAFLALSAGLYVLELIRDQPVLVTPLPDVLEPIVVALVPALVALLAGYQAAHTARPDLPPNQR